MEGTHDRSLVNALTTAEKDGMADDEPLISASETDEEIHVRRVPWQHKFGLIEMVQVTYFVSNVTALPVLEQYLYSRFLGHDTQALMPKDLANCVSNASFMNMSSPEIKAQRLTSVWMMMAMSFCFIPAILTTYFWGVYSDLRGRKLPMICASLGAFVKFIILLAVIQWKLHLSIFLLATVLDGCTGFFGTMLTCVYSYIADITRVGKARSRRLMALEVFNGVFVALAQFGVGFFIRYAGYFYPILALTFLQFLNVLLVMFIVPETRTPSATKTAICTMENIKRTVRVFTRRSPKGRRTTLYVGILAMILIDPALMTKRGVEVLYVLKSPLCWDSVRIGVYTSCTVIAQMIFVVIALRGLQKCLRDIVIAMLGAVSCTASVLFEAFSVTDTMMYTAAALGLLSFMAPPIIKGLMSEKISADEQGSMFSGLVSVQFMFQGIFLVALNAIYIWSVVTLPGLVFMVIAVCTFFSFFLLGYLALKTSPARSSHRTHNTYDLTD